MSEESIDAFDDWPLISVAVRSKSIGYFPSYSNAIIVLYYSRGFSLISSNLCATVEGGVPNYETISLTVIYLPLPSARAKESC
jgi:hypothetical protein